MHIVSDKQGGKTKVAILWDSVVEPEGHAKTLKRDRNKHYAPKFAKGELGDGQDWFGAPNGKVLKERLTQGWAEGAERLQDLAIREISPTSVRRRRIRGDQGDELDMQAVWRGDLSRAWTRTKRMSRAGTSRTITIVCNLGDNCGTDAATLFWRGASVLRLADSLTSAGYNIGIFGACAGNRCDTDDTVDCAQFVEIKATDAPLDLSALAGLTAMPGWFRTQGFAGIIAACDLADKDHDGGLGRPSHELAPYAEMLGLPADSMIFQPQINSREKAEAWIDEVLQQIEPSVE